MYPDDLMTSEALDKITNLSDEVSNILDRMAADIAHARHGKPVTEGVLIEEIDIETLRQKIMERLA